MTFDSISASTFADGISSTLRVNVRPLFSTAAFVAGLPIVEFAWSRKERDSLITKLLAKRDTLAAHVYDKIRFRLITRRWEDLGSVLRELCNRLVPFNYVIPGQSVNTLLPFEKIFEVQPATKRLRAELQPDAEINIPELQPNFFSSAAYRVINFVADLPLRAGIPIGDLAGGMFGTIGILAAVEAQREWSQWAWVMATMSICAGSIPAARRIPWTAGCSR